MARFTIYFKNKPIHSHQFDKGVIHIGRDDTNNITIDSLAVAPIHAVAIIREEDCLIKQVNNDFPLMVNNQPFLEYCLKENDRLNIGKHEIVYSHNGFSNEQTLRASPDESAQNTQEIDIPNANLQVLDGKHIGRIVPIKKAITRLGKSGEGVIIISRRKDGYFISALESSNKLTINKAPLDDQIIKLGHNDLISIENITMQFFLE